MRMLMALRTWGRLSDTQAMPSSLLKSSVSKLVSVTPRILSVAAQQQHTRRRAAPRRHDRGARVGDLSLAGVVAQLHHRLVDEPVAVGAALRQLAAVRVHGQ